MKTYPIVFSTDEKYLICLEVAIKSLIANSNKDKVYKLMVFHDNLEESKMEDVKKLAKENISIDFLNINKYIDSSILYEKKYFTKAMYYRILIPRIFSEYEKVLYLDCDLIVNCDIAEIFDENLDGYVIAGAKDIYEDQHANCLNSLNINTEKYINSGVLLFNVKEFKENNIEQKFFDLLKARQDLRCPDQDAINIVCADKIKLLDLKWNFQWGGLLTRVRRVVYADKFKEEYAKAEKEFKILHYTTSYKPWHYSKEKYADKWWFYAKDISDERITNFKKKTKQKLTFLKMCKYTIKFFFGNKFYAKVRSAYTK